MKIARITKVFLVLAAVLSGLVSPTVISAETAPEPLLVDCSQAETRLELRESVRLDPSCAWTGGIDIHTSDVVLDCQGARIVGPLRGRGIEISAPTDTALENITVRDCHVEGFLNSLRVTRDGFRDLAEGVEYENAFQNIVIEDSSFTGSRGVCVFVDGYVTGVTLRNSRLEGCGSSGVYLETGSKESLVENCDFVDIGYNENGPYWQPFDLGGQSFWFWGTGREGLSIDGSRYNRIVGNRFSGNSYGSIFLYKNCGEYPDRPVWFDRRYPSDGNLIEGNTFNGDRNGVWIGARMGENILPMECSEPQYRFGYSLDYAKDNIVRDNDFYGVSYGIRVEDDRNTISGNRFYGDGNEQAILIGTRYRTAELDWPVTETTVTDNIASIPNNPEPYRWLYRHADTVFADNLSLDEPARICEGVTPWTAPFVMAQTVVVGDSGVPPMNSPRPIPVPDPLPPCPCAGDCSGDGIVTVDEILRGVTIALGGEDLFACAAYDLDGSASVTVDELTDALDAVLNGCE